MRSRGLRLSTCVIVTGAVLASIYLSAEAGKGDPTLDVTIKSVEPDVLRLQPGEQGKVEITGENLDLAKAAVARSGRVVSQEVTSKLVCKNEALCTLELIASDQAQPQAYAIILIDGDQRDLAILPLKFELIGPRLDITSVKPESLGLKPGEQGKVEVSGTNLDIAADVLVRHDRETISEIEAQLTCKSSTLCVIELSVSNRVKPGAYEIALIDKTSVILATLALKFEILPLLTDEPQREVVIVPEPGHTILRSCTDTPQDTSMALLEPEAGMGLAVGSELVWARTDHEVCSGFGTNRRYVLAICDNPSPNFPCNPANGLYITVAIDPNVLGNGRCEVIPDDTVPADGVCQLTLAEIADRIGGIQPGDTVYWQMRYRADGSPDIFGEFTEKRPLLFNVTPQEPEPEPSCPGCPPPPMLFLPADGSVIDAVNRRFSWSDESPPNIPNDPNFPDWTWELCLMKPPSETCVGGPIELIDNSLSGLSYFEFDERGLIGAEMQWKVRACDESGLCGGFSAPFSAFVPLAPAQRVYPVHRAEVSPGRTFIWRAVEGAESYWLLINRTYEDADGFQVRQLVRQLGEENEIKTSVYLTAQDLQVLDKVGNGIPNEHLNRVSGWSVRACYDPDGPMGAVDDVCADSFFAPFESVGGSFVTFTNTPDEPGEVSFDALVDTFRSSSCVNCHTVAATDFDSGGDGTFGLPPNHPNVNASTDCTSCHNSTLLPPGTHDIPWQPAPTMMDFRTGAGVLKSAEALCLMGQNPGSVASDVADHLAGDPLILWAVVGGPLPFGAGNGERAFAGTLEEWQMLAHDWFEAGMPCEKPF